MRHSQYTIRTPLIPFTEKKLDTIFGYDHTLFKMGERPSNTGMININHPYVTPTVFGNTIAFYTVATCKTTNPIKSCLKKTFHQWQN